MIEKLFIFIFTLAENGIKFSFEFLEVLISAIPRKNQGYTSAFISPRTLLSKCHSGFCLTGKNNLSIKNSYQNALIVGGTGVGKSSVTLLPSLLSMQGSFIVNDPSGELLSKTSGALTQKNYTVKVLNFANPETSCGYNPLSRANSSSDVQKVASLLVSTALGGNTKDPFWGNMAISLLKMLITILKKQPTEFQNLYNVRQLLNSLGSNPEGVDALFSEHSDVVLFSEYHSLIKLDEKLLSSVIATCKSALNIFSDDAVAKVTSIDNLDFKEFREKPTALFIRNSVADQKYYSVLTSIFFEQFFSFVMSRFPDEGEQDIFFLIDEASSLKLPTLQLAIANVRKHRSGIMLVVQDFNQITNNYGKYEADAIKANCFAKLYYTGTSHETSKELEQLLGKFEYQDKQERKVVRPLMTNDEIRTMKENHALLICGHHKPILAKLQPHYKNKKYLQYSLIPAPEITNGISMDSIPILSLPVNSKKS